MAGRKKTEPTIETVFDEEVAAANSKPDTSERAKALTMGQKPKAKKEETDG